MHKKILTWIIIIAALVLVAAGSYWWYQSSAARSIYSSEIADNAQPPQQNAQNGNDGAGAEVKPSYTTAVRQYADRRIQFDENCLATPKEAAFKKGTVIMLDNRAGSPKTISLDERNYAIPAYDFALVTLTAAAPLPHDIMVDCGNGENNATIRLQQ